MHPELGTIADFRRLVDACARHNMEIALDIAVQCSPDHPWLKQHPEWFRNRADGTIPSRRRTRRRNTRISSIRISPAPTHRAVGSAARRIPFLGQSGREDLSGGQSAHQAVPVLGMAHSRDPRA
ncbi:MAG: hypothetical protein WDN48_17085 [Pseudolabrys sp.]